MRPRDWRLRVEDILDALERILRYTEGMSFDSFCADPKTMDAVIKNIAVMGEAATGIPEEFQAAHPEIPWRKMRDIRNVVIHEYFRTSLPILWQTVTLDVPPLLPPLKDLLKTP